MTQSIGGMPTATPGRIRPSLGRAFVITTGLLLVAGAVAACSSDSSAGENTSAVSAGVRTALVEVHSAPG